MNDPRRPALRRDPLLLPLFLTLGVLAIGIEGRAQQGCTLGNCHAKLLHGKSVHPVAEDCGTCHESMTTPHPQKGKKTFKLLERLPGLCSNCHDTIGKKSQVHFPVGEGQCTTCHDPHSSDQAKLLVESMKALCGSCHADQAEPIKAHAPVADGACTDCHVPHDSDNKSLLTKPGDGVCFDCHTELTDIGKTQGVHAAIEAGCTSCHNPHGSTYPKLLVNTEREVCFGCHDDIAQKVDHSPVAHEPAKSEDGCGTCHAPHASAIEYLLLKPAKEICLDCHDTTIKKSMTVLHGPVSEGKCGACHDPHGSQSPKLLVKEYPAEAYVHYTGKEFALCFDCHKRDLVQSAETSDATGFRDGKRNLHFVHVNNSERARSCKLCHDAHGSDNPKLIPKSVPFGKWELPLRFVKSDTGGGCSPGCHKPLFYDRESPGKRPDRPDAGRKLPN